MPRREELIEKYRDYPDRQLFEMLRHSRDYLPEAVEAARIVMEGRQIKAEKIDKFEKELAQKEKLRRTEAGKALSREEKILFSMVPLIGLVSLLMALSEADGRNSKKRISQLTLYAGIGLLVFVGLLFFLN